MGGGLAQLASFGTADVVLTGNPQITFFRLVYRRHTLFSIESIDNAFSGPVDFNKKATATIAKNGDLVHKVWLQVSLPDLAAYDVTPAPAEGQTVDATAYLTKGVGAASNNYYANADGANGLVGYSAAGKYYTDATLTAEIPTWPYMLRGATTATFRGVTQLPGTTVALAVGDNGDIFKTTNYTASSAAWTRQYNSTLALRAVSAASATVAWVVGAGGTILYTSDAGLTWAAQTSGVTQSLNGVWAASTAAAWAVGDNGVIVYTADAGSTWTETAQSRSVNYALNAISGASTTAFIAADGGNLADMDTSTGDLAWATTGTVANLYGVWAASSTAAWAVGVGGVIIATSNGSTWSSQTSGVATDLNAVSGTSSTAVWVVGAGGVVRSTTDGGSAWASGYSSGISGSPALRAVAAGASRVLVGAAGGVLAATAAAGVFTTGTATAYDVPAQRVRWCNAVGYALMKSVEIEIGGQRIDKHYSEWWDIWSELSEKEERRAGLWEMVGKYDDADYADTYRREQAAARTLYVPLTFCYNRVPGLSIPLVALQYNNVNFNIEFRPYMECIKSNVACTALTAKSGGTAVTFDDCKLYVDYIYLDVEERRRFATIPHELLVEQLQFLGDESILASTLNRKVILNFTHPVKELVFVYTAADNYAVDPVNGNSWFDYSIPEAESRSINPFSTVKLLINGHDRFSTRPGDYFKRVQTYQHHTRVPSKNILVYSFALNPEDMQPSGSCNFTRLDTAHLQLTMNAALKDGKIKIYALSYNILRISSGLAGLAFSN
jgi:photosystem II stability/assembly factor-like uncharacterized protein